MWPWEHLAIGYLAVSVTFRVLNWRPLGPTPVLFAVFGSQFPDLVDKPLGWWLGVLPSGTSLAHSAFVAVPLAVLVVAAPGDWHRRSRVAFAVAYLWHLPGDVVYGVLLGRDLTVNGILWPLYTPQRPQPAAIVPYVGELFAQFAASIASPAGALYLVLEVALLGTAVAVWHLDGRPGLGEAVALVRRAGR